MTESPSFPRRLAAAVLLGTLLGAVGAPAAVWDQLGPAEQEAVLEQLKERLPELLPADDPRPVVQGLRVLAAQDVGRLATLAGEVSGGDYDNAVDALLSAGAASVQESVEAAVEAHLTRLDSPAARWAHDFVKRNPGVSRDVARDLLGGRWREAGDKLYGQARTEAGAWVQRTTEANLRAAYDWVFGGHTLAGVTPADAFLFVVYAEVELIPRLSDRAEVAKLESLFARYNEWGRDFGALVDSGGVGVGFGRSGGFALWGRDLEDLRSLFESCPGGSLEPCLRARQEVARRQAQGERRALEQAMEAAAREESELLAARLEAIAAERDRLARASSADFAQRLAEARRIAAAIATAAGGVAAHCETFDGAADRLEAANETVRAAEAAVATAEAALLERRLCAEVRDDPRGLAGDLQGLAARAAAFEAARAAAERAATEACRAAQAVAAGSSRREAEPLLDRVTKTDRELATAVAAAAAAAADLRAGHQQLLAAVAEAKANRQHAASLAEGDPEAAAVAAITAVDGAREQFAQARAAMESAAGKAASLQHHVEQVNPVDLGWAARLGEELVGTPNRVENTRLFQLLWSDRRDPEAEQLLATGREQLATLRPPSCVTRWESLRARQWREPALPADLAAKLATAEASCRDLPAAADLDALVVESARQTAALEAGETALARHQGEGDRCVAAAAEAFAALPDAAAVLAAALAELEALCATAARHGAAAVAADGAAAEAARRLAEAFPDPLTASTVEALAACGSLPDLTARVAGGAAVVQARVAAATSAAAAAAAALARCGGSGDLAAAEAAERSARAAAREATAGFTDVQSADAGFDRVVAAARLALAEARQRRDQLSATEVLRRTLENHQDNLRRSLAAATAARDSCRAGYREVSARWGGALAEDASPAAAAARARLAAVLEPLGLELPAPERTGAAAGLGMVAAARDLLDTSIAELGACAAGVSPYGDVLAASQAMLGLDPVLAELAGLAGLRRTCEARLAAAGSPRGAAPGGYDPRADPDRPPATGGPPPDLGAVDEATGAGRVVPEPGYGGAGAEGPPIPPGSRDPADTGFEKPPVSDPKDPRGEGRDPARGPVRPTDPGIVDHGTSPPAGGPAGGPGGGGRGDGDGRPPGPAGGGPSGGAQQEAPSPGGGGPPAGTPPQGGTPPTGTPSTGTPTTGTTTPGGDSPRGGSAAECERSSRELAARMAALVAGYQASPGCERAKAMLREARRLYEALLATCGESLGSMKAELDRTIATLAQLEGVACEEGGGGGGSGDLAATVRTVTLRNDGVDNIHVCVDCAGSGFTLANRLSRGQTGSLEVTIPAGQANVTVRFNAGRNQQVRASAACTVGREGRVTVRYTETAFNAGSALVCQ